MNRQRVDGWGDPHSAPSTRKRPGWRARIPNDRLFRLCYPDGTVIYVAEAYVLDETELEGLLRLRADGWTIELSSHPERGIRIHFERSV